MRLRRWVACIFVLLGLVIFSTAMAAEPIALDEIGMRYTPTEGEIIVTRASIPESALEALGADTQTLTAVMVGENVHLISIGQDGRQFSLIVTAKPAEISATDASKLTAAEKELFLAQLARHGEYGSAAWQDGGYALFSAPVHLQADEALLYSDLTLATIYLDQLYTLRMDVIGRETTAEDAALLKDAANRLLRLGASSTGTDENQAEAPLTLPTMQVASNPAELTYIQHELELSLDPIADTIGVTQFTLAGNTVPYGYLRFSLGGNTSSRVKADENGAFSFTIPGLTGNAANLIELSAFKGEEMTVVTFTVTVDWQLTPLVLSPVTNVEGKTVTLSGLTLPGTTVKLTQGRGPSRIIVAQDGSFAVTLILGRFGENSFTLQAQAAGYHRNDHSLTITRALSTQEAIETLQKKVKTIDYARLTAQPEAYAERVVQLSGTAGDLTYTNGQPSYVLTADDNARYAVLCGDLLLITDGLPITLVGTLTGDVNATHGCPALTLAAYIP